MDDDSQLIWDTLYDRRRSPTASCLVVNEAGIALLRQPPDVLPVIEKVLEKVNNDLSIGSRNDEAVVRRDSKKEFQGLVYVLGAYLVIGAKSDFDRVQRFLLQMSDIMLLDAISAVPAFFRRVDGGYNFGVSPSDSVINFLSMLSRSERQGIGAAATIALQKVDASNRLQS